MKNHLVGFNLGLLLSLSPALATEAPAVPTLSSLSAYLGAREAAHATYSADGDFLFVGRRKVLIRWQGLLRASRTDTEGRMPVEDGQTLRSFGDLFSSSRPVLVSALSRLPGAPESLRRLPSERALGSWTCDTDRVYLHLAPTERELTPLESTSFEASELLQTPNRELDRQGEDSLTQILACGITSEGKPYALLQEEQWLHFVLAFTGLKHSSQAPGDAPLVLASSPAGGSAVNLLLVAESEQTRGDEIFVVRWDSSGQQTTILSTGLPIRGHERSFMRAVLRDGTALVTSDERLWLFETASPRSTTRLLPVAPCAERQICGLSLAPDQSWAISGYWGHYVGRGEEFRRIAFPQFSREEGPVTLAHSGLPGETALFGEFDASFESVKTELASRDATIDPKLRSLAADPVQVAWLKPGISPNGDERGVLRLPALPHPRSQTWSIKSPGAKPKPLDIVLTRMPFDPSRHVAYEKPRLYELSPLEPSSPPSSNRRASRKVHTHVDKPWWQNSLDLPRVSADLQNRRERPPYARLAIIDSGADLTHPDFDPHARYGSDQGPSEGHLGYDFVDEDWLPMDEHGHGTHVSGLAKSPFWAFSNIDLLIYRALDRQGRSNSIDLGRAILEATQADADVINASWGGGAATQFMEDTITAAEEAGVLFVTSAGNGGLRIDDNPPVPTGVPGVITIGAHGPNGRRASFSNYGQRRVLTLFPGVDILSLALGGGTTLKSGTSMAAPLFSAFSSLALGLLRELGVSDRSAAKTLFIEAFCQASEGVSASARCQNGTIAGTFDALLALQN